MSHQSEQPMTHEIGKRTYVVAEVDPFDTDGVRTVAVGTILWLVLFLGLLPFYARLRDDGRLWWLWTCLAGFGLGLAGWDYCRRRRHRLEDAEWEDWAGDWDELEPTTPSAPVPVTTAPAGSTTTPPVPAPAPPPAARPATAPARETTPTTAQARAQASTQPVTQPVTQPETQPLTQAPTQPRSPSRPPGPSRTSPGVRPVARPPAPSAPSAPSGTGSPAGPQQQQSAVPEAERPEQDAPVGPQRAVGRGRPPAPPRRPRPSPTTDPAGPATSGRPTTNETADPNKADELQSQPTVDPPRPTVNPTAKPPRKPPFTPR